MHPCLSSDKTRKSRLFRPVSLSLSSVGGGWGGIFLGLCGAVIWRCLFNTSEERVARGATWPCYPFPQLPGIAILSNTCNCLLIINKHKTFRLHVCCVPELCVCWGCVVWKEIEENRACVERPERCLSISYSCKVEAVVQSHAAPSLLL